MADDIVYDEMLGELRTSDVSGGTGGGGSTYIAGDGLNLAGGTFSLATAEVQDVLNGTQTVEAVDVSALRGALTAGQAVDVTSQPDNVAGDYKGTFTINGTLGFASFPKYASGLNYLFIADLTATTSGTVTPSGTWLDGTTTAKTLAAGTSTRVAMLFNAANKAKLTFASTGSVSVSNCREYEVTACSNEAITYIAALNNPDAFASYYLVKSDMVQPWTYIIDMGSSPAVTIASGLSYKLNAATGTHILTVDTCPAGYDGRDAIIRIRLGGTGVVQAVAPLQLGGALVPYAINNCVVRFRDGEAVLLVEDTLAGYVVTVNSGTGEGSLPYGLAANGVPYIAFSPSTDGIPVDLSGATTAPEEVTVVGNGRNETFVSGTVTVTSQTTLTNLTFSGSIVANGATLLADGIYHIDTVTGAAGLTIGSGAIVDLTGNTNATPIAPSGGIVFASGGATVLYSSGAVSGSYMMDNAKLPAGAKLTNTAMVDLGGITTAICYGSASGISISSGRLSLSGGTANSTTVYSGGYLHVSSGGTANSTTVSNGFQRVYAGGYANSTTAYSGGWLVIYSGGTVNEPTLNSGSVLTVSSGASALLVTSNTGANITVVEGGYISYKE